MWALPFPKIHFFTSRCVYSKFEQISFSGLITARRVQSQTMKNNFSARGAIFVTRHCKKIYVAIKSFEEIYYFTIRPFLIIVRLVVAQINFQNISFIMFGYYLRHGRR